MIKVIAFDAFGTVFDLSSVDKEEIREYARHLRQEVWSPLNLPSSWATLPAHPDARVGLQKLRDCGFKVCTMSNGPVSLLNEMSRNSGIEWDMLIPIEERHVFKPDPRAYAAVAELFRVKPEQTLMVTANPRFGDIEGSAAIGMPSQVIRHGRPNDIIELYEWLNEEVLTSPLPEWPISFTPTYELRRNLL